MSIYLPDHFRETDDDALFSFVESHSFGMLVSIAGAEPFVSHVPMLLDRPTATISGHLARANPHWRHLGAAGQALAVFSGPHAYVSPSWYTATGVPTWNFCAVHVSGAVLVMEDEPGIRRIVERLTAIHESPLDPPWRVEKLPPGQLDKMLGAIVAFEMTIERLEGKFKLSQNRSRADQHGVIDALEHAGAPGGTAIAELMRRRLRTRAEQ